MEGGGRIGAGPAGTPDRWRHRFAFTTSAATLFLIFAGGMVTSTGSGLAVPDWPLSYGGFFPPMVGGVFYEHGHRMVAGTVGLLMIALALWTWRREPRRWVRRLAAGAVLAVVAQALLGGITVLFLLPPAVSISHAALANLFFAMTVVIAAATGPWWLGASADAGADGAEATGAAAGSASRDGAASPDGAASRDGAAARAGSGGGRIGRATAKRAPLFFPAVAVTGAAFLQILLGALMRHTKAGLAIPDFPLAFGRLIPPLSEPRVAVHFAHRLGAVTVAALAGFVVARALRHHRGRPDLVAPALILGALVLAQLVLGATVVWTAKQPHVTTFHVAAGSAALAAALVLALRAGRLERPGARSQEVAGLTPIEGRA